MLRPLLATVTLLFGGAHAQPEQIDALKVESQYKTVQLDELRSGGPPPNGIPPLGFQEDHAGLPDTRPARFETVKQAAKWLTPREPVILVSVDGETGIFPLQVLIWHEIANVTLGRVPVAVTFCPLCNTALVADRRVPVGDEQRSRLGGTPGSELLVTFGVSGMLYKSDLVMFDSATHSLWYQAIGRGIVGTLAGTQLRIYPSLIVSFQEAAREAPEARVLSRNTGYPRDYGRNPYVGYDDADEPPFLYSGPLDGRLAPKERVVTVSVGDTHAAYPFGVLSKGGVVNDRVADTPVVVFWSAGTASALDTAQIGEARDVGAGVVFDRRLGERSLTFERVKGAFRDRETGSLWSIAGRAISGPLKGRTLRAIAHANHFWFAWAAYAPQTRLYAPR
ncbi:DUF3179 domain-containing protein [Deinococcus peraridilitoris]|uniref:DUF3179 domain-containing protein n=1 Tax=Deinococcus peraridilitoris (strain DSM 19664 / LMG 22246 / CIP 109416 / KR-200) TaxID=937777 RepID=K9ZXE6_DEIPD|nr:DUF3179 domain-containing protein [Deinococcus peraridilitoris]AFZ66246.1 Protein of unknown function (DUF3179) [Deinococcus peraridilitoris DSM 19664]